MKFVAGPWEPETRAGTFRRFIEAHSDLERAVFLERLQWPHLVIGCELDPRTWDRGIVLRVAPREPGKSAVTLGRGEGGGADIPLNCPTLSSRHATFTQENGKHFVTDEGSRTGTYLDAVKLDSGQRVELAGGWPTLDFGPDVRAVFLVPEALFDFLKAARAARPGDSKATSRVPRVARSEGRAEWPTYSLIQESASKTATSHDLPAFALPPGGTRGPERGPVHDGSPRDAIVVPGFWQEQRKVLFGTRLRIARTIGVVVALSAILAWMGRPLLILVFATEHPDWFR